MTPIKNLWVRSIQKRCEEEGRSERKILGTAAHSKEGRKGFIQEQRGGAGGRRNIM